jgi:gamma-glutamyltranspeptidase/glutathione hydrolase
VERLIAKDYAAARRALIDRDRAAAAPTHGDATAGAGDTVYLAAADDAGNMVSLIQSNYMGFGSGVTVVPFGFGLQNRGSQFALDPRHANVFAPGKRPFHTIIPAFITKDGKPWVSFGVMGGAMQPQGHAQIVMNLVDFGMNLQEAGDAPRILHTGSSQPTGEEMTDGGFLTLETGFDYEVIRELVGRRHQIGWNVGSYGGYQAILWDAEHGVPHDRDGSGVAGARCR